MPHQTPSLTSVAAPLDDLQRKQLPRHIAAIMDGNGRWATSRGMPRLVGHREGAATVRKIVTECVRLELEALTLYSFSSENWKRPKEEVTGLMELCAEFLALERPLMIEQNIRFRRIGSREGLPTRVLDELDATEAATSRSSGLTLCLAMNYGSRTEIADAAREIARKVEQGTLRAEEVTDLTIAEHLYTAGIPDPDLLIRTAGSFRVSNFLLWQISYAEIHVTDVLWPDFAPSDLHAAVRDFTRRERKFGELGASVVDAKPSTNSHSANA
ncbi:MAG: isoprenyl transferase [Phycisphaerales bacterium]|nr:isoprenyl transferase [Phycisphaerales bacterium]